MAVSNKKMRESNIELLRIVTMYIILAHHYVVHGVMRDYSVWAGGGSAVNKIFSAFLIPGGQVGVAVFFMISGYFLIQKTEVNFSGLLKIILECVFYGWLTLGIFIVAFLLGYRIPGIEIKELIYLVVRSFFLPATSGLWWFVSAYILLILLSPIVNNILNRFSNKGLFVILAVQWVLYYVIGSLGSAYFDLYKAIFFYSVGACYHIVKIRSKVQSRKFLPIICLIIGWCIAAMCGYEQATASLQEGLSGDLKVKLFALIQLAIATPICSLSLLDLFDNMKVKPSKTINRIASTTFGIYLFHDADLISNLLWNKWLKVDTLQYSSRFFIVYCVLTVVIVFSLLSCLDLLRQRIEPKVIEKIRRIQRKFVERY